MDTSLTTLHDVYLALGTNLGDRLFNLRIAREALRDEGWLARSSAVYQTPPWGILNQPPFLNQVVEIATKLSPIQLLQFIKDLEKRMGRAPSVRYGPRLIDIDILFYNKMIINQRGLSIPHPLMAERAFVLMPLADLAAEFQHPATGFSVSEMLAKVDTSGIQRITERE